MTAQHPRPTPVARRAWRPAALLAVAAIAAAGAGCTEAQGDSAAVSGTVATLPSTSAPAATSSSSTSTTSTSTTTTIPPVRSVSMAFSGDVLIHTSLWEQARETAGGNGYDFSPMFAETAPLVEAADLGICHLEVPIAPPGEEPSTFPLYGAPRELVAGIKSGGYDRCSTASNHTLDQGTAGIEATLAEFDAQGMGQSGMARTPDEIAPRIIEVNGVRICHLSYTWSFNGLQLPVDEPWRSAEIDPDRIIADATSAREAGAEIVVVSMHWGAETVAAVTSTQRRQAEAITASGQVDLIVGHHTHVVQPIEQVNGIWTVFGMGNVLSNHPTRDFFPPSSQDGVIVSVAFEVSPNGAVAVARPVVYPTWVDRRDGYVIRDVLRQLDRADLPSGKRAAYEESLARTSRVVGEFFPPA